MKNLLILLICLFCLDVFAAAECDPDDEGKAEFCTNDLKCPEGQTSYCSSGSCQACS